VDRTDWHGKTENEDRREQKVSHHSVLTIGQQQPNAARFRLTTKSTCRAAAAGAHEASVPVDDGCLRAVTTARASSSGRPLMTIAMVLATARAVEGDPDEKSEFQ
jgi:hypothetical protein